MPRNALLIFQPTNPPPLVQDPDSRNEIDTKVSNKLVFKFYISELKNYLQFRYSYTRAFVIQK